LYLFAIEAEDLSVSLFGTDLRRAASCDVEAMLNSHFTEEIEAKNLKPRTAGSMCHGWCLKRGDEGIFIRLADDLEEEWNGDLPCNDVGFSVGLPGSWRAGSNA
jgi:hypothetical protein